MELVNGMSLLLLLVAEEEEEEARGVVLVVPYAVCTAVHDMRRACGHLLLHDFYSASVRDHEHFGFPAEPAQEPCDAVFVLFELFRLGLGEGFRGGFGRIFGGFHRGWR